MAPYLQMVRTVVVVAVVDEAAFVCAVDSNELEISSDKIFHGLDNHFRRRRHHFDAKQNHHYFDGYYSGRNARCFEFLVFCCLVARHSRRPMNDHCNFVWLQIEPRFFVVVVVADDAVVAVAGVMIHVNRIDLAVVSWDRVHDETTDSHHSQVDGLCKIDGIDIDWDAPWDNVVVAVDNDCGYCCMYCSLSCLNNRSRLGMNLLWSILEVVDD